MFYLIEEEMLTKINQSNTKKVIKEVVITGQNSSTDCCEKS